MINYIKKHIRSHGKTIPWPFLLDKHGNLTEIATQLLKNGIIMRVRGKLGTVYYTIR